ncbi:hypothetical protein MCUN1_001312 [Malassezia cuniculi]|uniref:BOD1/SHG1 domain-containing protein n=1 Tax=Malassezia cuniculi TaxID=948313 RepID=A0AAF0JAM9_9BASI|nr:hypothetical protein MCUN1_001312 [Malassezia cuniculi]
MHVLVDEFKRRGHFDQVRKQLLQQFQEGGQMDAILKELDDRLEEHVTREADRLAFRDARLCHADLMRHADTLPIVNSLGERLRGSHDSAEGALLAQDGPIAQTIAAHVAALVAAHADSSSGADTPNGTPGSGTPLAGTTRAL